MQNRLKHAGFALLLLSALNSHLSTVFAQGSLTPPGAPAPTMKTLDQIEARTPISMVLFTITNSGSYYLTINLNVTNGDAITINTNQVTLDLNGFTISSTAISANGTGILIGSGVIDITIFNGHIKGGVTYNGTYSGGGFANGIHDSCPNPCSARIKGIWVSGCSINGIYLVSFGSTSVIEGC